MTLYHWSQTAASNGTSDITCPFPEGMAPSAVNDGTRGMMAAVAKYRDDVAGGIATAGTSTAYTVSSYQGFDSLADMSGKEVWFTPHTTNGATVTINVDSLGAKPLRTAPGVELLPGIIVQGTPYGAIYNNTDGAWYLKGVFGTPFVPVGVGFDYWGSTAPNSSLAFAYGQAINRVTYAALYAIVGTTYGAGDGSTTFNLPDKRGRISAALDNMGGSAASRLTTAGGGVDGSTLGANGGNQAKTITTPNLPPYTPAGSIANGAITVTSNQLGVNTGASSLYNQQAGSVGTFSQTLNASQAASTFTGTAQGGTSTPMSVVPPVIICNYLIRII